MELLHINELKKFQGFIQEIRWDVTPNIFLNPESGSAEEVDITHGYMLYVDVVNDIPALVIMQLKRIMSKTVGYIYDIPDELLKEALQCADTKSVGGMYPLSGKLEEWLKKEFGLS
ncbi:MAG TPA: hypothetical protein ENG83_09945 [Nitrospirae bacterium]|nr:hypothetical protein BMS3Abin06_01956 [bacterium BMS3Abin06]HDH12495.1 hypothetical protein [Nitrospirota bacterium]HDZ02194.1 hypothetical protein [Nitrospirota bacterium]